VPKHSKNSVNFHTARKLNSDVNVFLCFKILVVFWTPVGQRSLVKESWPSRKKLLQQAWLLFKTLCLQQCSWFAGFIYWTEKCATHCSFFLATLTQAAVNATGFRVAKLNWFRARTLSKNKPRCGLCFASCALINAHITQQNKNKIVKKKFAQKDERLGV